MVTNLFPQFLDDPKQYTEAELFWERLWERIEFFYRHNFSWSYPWLGTGSPAIRDGNPIFSAHSPVLRRGVRIIQMQPIGPGLDIQVWLDTFGGGITDPDRVHELVISCVLSDAVAMIALPLMSQWVGGHPISFRSFNDGILLPNAPKRARVKARSLVPAA